MLKKHVMALCVLVKVITVLIANILKGSLKFIVRVSLSLFPSLSVNQSIYDKRGCIAKHTNPW